MRNRIYPEWFIEELAYKEDKQRAIEGKLLTGDKVDFICPIHGIYNQRICNHIKIRTGEKFNRVNGKSNPL